MCMFAFFERIMMKMVKCLMGVVLAMALPVQAADFVSQKDNRPQALSQTANVQVVNFWATWCGPCRKEMPAMSKWYTQKGKAKGVEMVGIAVDSKENVAKFLLTTPVLYPIWRYEGNNSRAMMKAYGNVVGGLPYTVVRAPKCGVQQTLLGEVDAAKLDSVVAAVQGKCRR